MIVAGRDFITTSMENDLPDYRILKILGTGATSHVYLATQKSLGRSVAVKRFAPGSALPKNISERFEREAAVWAHLNHENIIHLYDYRSTENARYMVMEYCHGIELYDLLALAIYLPPAVAASIGHQILSGLDYLHQYGIVHRDLKPGNIFITSRGAVKLMDFGISLCSQLEPVTAPGQILGTPLYMSPEQATGHVVGPASDLFSFGIVLYEMIEGKRPFSDSMFKDFIRSARKGRYSKFTKHPPSVIKDLIRSCLKGNLRKRCPSALKAIEEIDRYFSQARIRSAQNVVARFLISEGHVTPPPNLFPDNILEQAQDSPLSKTYAAMLTEARGSTPSTLHRGSRIGWLILLITIAALGAILFLFLRSYPELISF